ncbi:MAG: type 4a pilus biogenesis protein PilO [Pirellulaceae bacterium]|jgi:Tfp pilus assembly protein PilO|nr:hypothetical protein [Planctomycetaceae bacterium]MDP6467344.1 type 4a pilus biogenesis protein PilO [Pirellulaceae bacterium]MDP6556973.1 type 4a pilus biogenesis protein PilO [Pirellulaceae bacterium]
MKKTTPKARSFVLTVSIGGLVLLYAFFVFLPTSRSIAKTRSALNEKRQFIVATQQDYTQIGAIQKDLKNTKDWVAAWKHSSPKRNNLGGFFRDVAEISRESGTQVKRITPDEFEELRSLSRHPVRLDTAGRFNEIFAFVQALEQMPFTVWIDRLQLQSSSEASEELTCELSLTVFTDNQDISD